MWKLVKKAVSKIYRGGGDKYYLYLPKGLVTDSAFPFTPEDKLEIEITQSGLVVRKVYEGDYPGVGPFILGQLSSLVKSGEAAEQILREKAGKLTEKQKAYLKHVIEEGRRAKRDLEKYVKLWRKATREPS